MLIREAVIESVDRLIASGAVQAAIEKRLKETIERVIEDSLSSYGEFGKALKETVQKSLQITGDLDIPSYNDAILKIVRAQVAGRTNALIQQQVAKELESLLEPAPESIKFSALVESYVTRLREERKGECVCYGSDQPYAVCTVEDSSTAGFKYILLSEDQSKSSRQCDIRIGVHRDRIFSLQFANRDLEKEMFVGKLHGFERALFQMKAAGTKIEFDADPDDLDLCYATDEEHV